MHIILLHFMFMMHAEYIIITISQQFIRIVLLLYIASHIYGHDWIDQWTTCIQYSTIGTSVTFNMNSQQYTPLSSQMCT